MKRNLIRSKKSLDNSEIVNMFRSANRVEYSGIKLFYKSNSLKWNRVAILLKKGFNSAVQRNREKRIVKECYKNLKNFIHIGNDIILLIFPKKNSYTERFSQVLFLLQKAGLIINEESFLK